MSKQNDLILKKRKEIIKKDIEEMFKKHKNIHYGYLVKYIIDKELDEIHMGEYENLETGKIINFDEIQYEHVLSKYAKSVFMKHMKKKEEQVQKDQEEKKSKRKGEPVWVACKTESMLDVIEKMSIQTAHELVKLLTSMTMDSKGMLVDERGVALKAGEIGTKILKISRAKASPILNELETLKIIKPVTKGKSKFYKVDQRFHSMGEEINEAFVKLYKKSVIDLLEKYDLGAGLGVLYKILPYVHKQRLCICWNPNQDLRTDKKRTLVENIRRKMDLPVRYISQKDIATIVGMTPQGLNKYFRMFDKMNIMFNFGEGKEPKYIFHPDFINREDLADDGAYSVVIRSLFDDRKKPSYPKSKNKKKKTDK